jgi:hypothetical protein
MLSFLKKPYPYYTFSVRDIYSNFLIGCFVAFFLIVFQPYEIPLWQTDAKILKLIGFGFVSFICPLVFRFIFTLVLKNRNIEETWTVWKEILGLLSVICFIALGNLFYGNLIKISHFNFQELTLALAATFLLAVFPITANVAIKYNRFLALNQKDAELMEAEVLHFQNKVETENSIKTEHNEIINNGLLVLIAENEKDKIEIIAEELLFIESADNYSNIIFYKNNKVNKQLLRGSLKRIESQITFPFIVRCHRSYIVNLKLINHIKGNAQGYRIDFKIDQIDSIPVSRNYSKALFERLESFK